MVALLHSDRSKATMLRSAGGRAPQREHPRHRRRDQRQRHGVGQDPAVVHQHQRRPVQPRHHQRRDPGDEHRAAAAQPQLPGGDRPQRRSTRAPGDGEQYDRLRVERGHHRAARQPGGRRGEQVHAGRVEPGRGAGEQVDRGELPGRSAAGARHVRGLQDVHDHVVFLRSGGERTDARDPGPGGERDPDGDHRGADDERRLRAQTQNSPCTNAQLAGPGEPHGDGGGTDGGRHGQQRDRPEGQADRRDEHRRDPRDRDGRRRSQGHHEQPRRHRHRREQHEPRHVRDHGRRDEDQRVAHR